MTDEELMREIGTDSPLNRARKTFRFAAAGIEQAQAQRRLISPVQVRRMEFEAVERIAAELGLRTK